MEKQGRVLSLIAQDPADEEKFVVCQQTVACMREFEGDFCFISICGEYRSGKSFLLNALFPESCGFETSATTISCTRGINVWSRPLKHNGLNIWLVDTEGFGSIEKDSQHDGRLFLLNLLLSNIVLYNSVGAIDEQALAKLALVCRRAAALNESAPATKLFWVLRDFALQMADRSGRQLTADQYLEECLREGHPGQRNEKEFLRSLFEERHCVALIRPLIDQEQLGSLKQVRWDSLREQFRSGVRDLQEGLLKAAESKVINGVHIGSHNFSLLLQEFVGAINDGDIDCGLNPTYERILQYEQAARKEAIITAMTAKVDAVRKIMPVQLQHLVYLQQQLADIIRIQLQDLEGYSNRVAIQLLKLQLASQSFRLCNAFQKDNRERLFQDVRQYLYRQLIEVCPRLVSLGLQGFQSRFQQTFAKLKEEYAAKYATFLHPEDLQAQYSLFAEREERKVFFEVTKRWRAAHRELQQKAEELRKGRRGLEEECKKLKQEREHFQQVFDQVRKEEDRNIERMKDDVEQAFREEAKIIARGYESRMQEQTIRWEEEISTLKETAERAQNERAKARTEAQYERQSLNERVNAERERSDLLAAKWEQALSSLQLQLKETKNSLENKLRIAELKNSDLQSTLSSERKKFQIISQERKSEENRVLHDLAEYRHRVDELTDELGLLERKYREQLERILQQEKQIICTALNAKLNEYAIRCKSYQAETASIAAEKDFQEKRNRQLELEKGESRKSLEKLQDIVAQLQNKIRKYETKLEEGEKAVAIAKQQQLKEISLLNENLTNSKNLLKEAEQRHKQELERLRAELQSSMREQASILTGQHADVVERLRSQLEAKWEDERSKLKEVIRNGYDETQGLRMALFTLTAHTDNIAVILNRVLSYHHHHTDLNNSGDSSHLTDIAESPEENTDRYSPGKREQLIRQTEFLAEEIEEIYSSIRSECEHLGKERVSIREQLKAKIDELQSYKQAITKLKQENKGLRGELEQGKERLEDLRRKTEGVSRDVGQLRDRTEGLQRENAQLRRQCELKEQLLSTRDENHKQNSFIYKETIAGLTDQNRELAARAGHLSANNEALQSELQRFQIWATEVKSKSTHSLPSDEMEMSTEKIRDLEGEIKRLARQLHESKVDKGRQVNLYTPMMQQNRYNELEALRNQNQLLLRQLQDKQQMEAKLQQEKRMSRQRQAEQDESRYSSLKEECEGYKRRSKDTIAMLESKIAVYQEENRQLRQEYQELQDNILQKYEFDLKLREQEVQELKKQKSSIAEFYAKKIQNLQDNHNSKFQESERRIAESSIRYQQFRSELEKEHNRIMLESERHRLKYEHLLKVNGELIKQVQALKSKAHQMTIKEKYKSRISSLFDD